MPNSKSPKLSVAPEFVGLGRLAKILKPDGAAGAAPSSVVESADIWTVFGVGAIWQTAAENAARLSQSDLATWLTAAINEAAGAQGLSAVPADPAQSEAKARA